MLLDVDGTLVDSNDAHAHAWVEALARGGHDVKFEQVRWLIGMGSDNFLPAAVGVQKETSEGEKLSDWWSEIFKSKYLPKLRAFPRTRDLLQRMRDDGLKLVVASSAEEDMLEALLEIAGATDLVEARTSSGDVDKSKPDPDIVKAALDSSGCPPNQVVMLGDTPYDIKAASKERVDVIALRCGGYSDADLAGAFAIYDDPADLLARYDQSPLAPAAPD